MAIGNPVALYTATATPTSSQLEAEWSANWRPNTLQEEAPYLFSEIAFDAAFVNPTTLKLYVRNRSGLWSLVLAVTLTGLDPSDGAYQDAGRFIGNGCSGWVWYSRQVGTAVCSRSRGV